MKRGRIGEESWVRVVGEVFVELLVLEVKMRENDPHVGHGVPLAELLRGQRNRIYMCTNQVCGSHVFRAGQS